MLSFFQELWSSFREGDAKARLAILADIFAIIGLSTATILGSVVFQAGGVEVQQRVANVLIGLLFVIAFLAVGIIAGSILSSVRAFMINKPATKTIYYLAWGAFWIGVALFVVLVGPGMAKVFFIEGAWLHL